ncbi:hypothetical protein [Streptomyces sp. NPDC096132]|uniref:hypothetical protein n=1 Tax=Streptomyces sp. NPDC096132 TaxID=3366075 RepID=UPI00382284DD
MSSKVVVTLAYGIAAVVAMTVVALSFTWGIRDVARYYIPAALIVLAAGAIHYRMRGGN